MIEFKYNNVNPVNNITSDCTTRALTLLLDIPYKNAILLQANKAIELNEGFENEKVMGAILKDYGYHRYTSPKIYGRTARVCEMDKVLLKEELQNGVLIFVSSHATCIKDGTLQDIWDCGDRRVQVYFSKDVKHNYNN